MTEENNQDLSLSVVFDQALELQRQVEESNEDSSSPNLQAKIKKGILMLEDATRLVSILDIFSRNENYKELPTDHLKYFLLPVLLGDLQNRLTENERTEVVVTCQVYYIDFLQRCKEYGFTDLKIPKLKRIKENGEQEENDERPQTSRGRPDLAKMNAEREGKMARFREKKELESEIANLRQLTVGPTRDEDLIRDLYIKTVKRFINVCQDELSSLHMEIDVLGHMAAMRLGKVAPVEEKKSRPLQPIIITKDKMQKEVYGLGYPSLPVLSVDEFYDQRVKEGWFPPGGGGTASSLQDKAMDPERDARLQDEHEREEDAKVDRDDEEELQRKRNWDEWTDDHRRGEGNRKNMG